VTRARRPGDQYEDDAVELLILALVLLCSAVVFESIELAIAFGVAFIGGCWCVRQAIGAGR
jgi:hypothetical protein